MEISVINNIAAQEVSKEQSMTQTEAKTINEATKSHETKTTDTVKKASSETTITPEKPVRDSYISSEKELKDASGLYSVARKSEGGMEIKFDDIKLQKKRNDLKSEITRLKSSNAEEDRKKAVELTKKLASVEKKSECRNRNKPI